MNQMREIRIEKITLNIGTGGPGEKLDKAMRLLNKITGMKVVSTVTKERIPGLDIRPGLQIGCKVTIRGNKAKELLGRLLKADISKLSSLKFDVYGNFSFGVSEYIDIQGIEYDASIGIIGLDVAVSLERPGFRIKRRSIKKRKIPLNQRITKEESIEFINKTYNIG